MNRWLRLALTFAAGAAAMYYFDPSSGRRRRARVRDRGVSARHDLERFACAKSKRAADRLHGVVARTRARIADAPVDDDRLRDRVRARLGHVVERPGAIDVKVRDGRVVLSGTASSREEIDEAIGAVATMPGVGEIDNLLAPARPDSAAASAAQH